MTATLENAAKNLLSDPPWMRVFKNTYDSIEDQLNKLLLAIATIGMGVRLASALASGFLVCIVTDIQTNPRNAAIETPIWLDKLSGPYAGTLAAYAAQDSNCHNQILKPRFDRLDQSYVSSLYVKGFLKYASVLMMLEIILLILLEKVALLFFPRMNQKLERFYKAVVEEALLGKDPDVAEDFHSFSTEKIARERQRQEICGAIRNSSFFYGMFMVKNVLEILFAIVFVFFNTSWLWAYDFSESDVPGICDIDLLRNNVTVVMQCKEKRHDIFVVLLNSFTAVLVFHMIINILSVLWGLNINTVGLKRKLSSLIETLQNAINKADDEDVEKGRPTTLSRSKSRIGRVASVPRGLVEDTPGQDFLFLFDLIAHTCGKAATLRVLSFSEPSFEQFCQPELDLDNIEKTENRVVLRWGAAKLHSTKKSINLQVDEYVATIFPGNNGQQSGMVKESLDNTGKGKVIFEGLEGGTVEYVITVSAMVNNAKLKGARHHFHLPPHPPQNLVCSFKDEEDTKRGQAKVKIVWERPKGQFSKYKMVLERLQQQERKGSEFQKRPSFRRLEQTSVRKPTPNPNEREIWLPAEQKTYEDRLILPGEMYKVTLNSMTSEKQPCRKPPHVFFLSKPGRPGKLEITCEESGKVLVSWSPPPPPGNSARDGYKLVVKKKGDTKEVLQRKPGRGEDKIELEAAGVLLPAVEYVFSLYTTARAEAESETDALDVNKIRHSESLPAEETFVMVPSPPRDLKLESSSTSSIKVKWEQAPEQGSKVFFRVLNEEQWQSVLMVKENKENKENIVEIKKLESGKVYEVSVAATVVVGEKTFESRHVKSTCVVKPLAPAEYIASGGKELVWKRSVSSNVRMYELTIKKDEEKALSYEVEDIEDDVYCRGEVTFTLPSDFAFEEGSKYKINVYSIVEHDGERIKSDSLHKKLPEEPQMREDVNDNINKRQSARISRSKTNVGSLVRKKVKPVVFASQFHINQSSTSVPATPIVESYEDFSSVRTPSYLLRHGSLGADQVITDEDLQRLASLNTPQNSNNRDKMDREEMSGSYTSIEEESEQTLTSKEDKRKMSLLMPDVEDVEENERTLTSKEGKMLAEEFMAYSRHNSDSLTAPSQEPKRDSRGARGVKSFLDN